MSVGARVRGVSLIIQRRERRSAGKVICYIFRE